MAFKIGDFAIYADIPVTIKKIDGSKATIDHCVRLSDDDDSVELREMLAKYSMIKVEISELLEFNLANRKRIRDKYNEMIGMCNVVIHTIDDCERYC